MNPQHKLIAEAIKERIDYYKGSSSQYHYKAVALRLADIFEEENCKCNREYCYKKPFNKTEWLKIAGVEG